MSIRGGGAGQKTAAPSVSIIFLIKPNERREGTHYLRGSWLSELYAQQQSQFPVRLLAFYFRQSALLVKMPLSTAAFSEKQMFLLRELAPSDLRLCMSELTSYAIRTQTRSFFDTRRRRVKVPRPSEI